MNYPNVPSILETDDLDELREITIQTYETGQEVTLVFTINPRKHYHPGQVPERVFLTDGVVPRFLSPTPRPSNM
jgi:hypothetical protein